ncbi:hypothetical protein BIU82_13455 [Arthrobacter sp. SW1]|uniref:metal ABC transporter substrate-binding protein n=1 Tax=Arthrobacter sp. SW1 TaxID=1920889 RepID=UPI000877BCE1|nr:metal ABC transporter substrate-binding protein [Arthrobacter sp. SW1]OFI36499.1 hypothetical protein BIU82_13455 [Arthrobacter sp. SW1]
MPLPSRSVVCRASALLSLPAVVALAACAPPAAGSPGSGQDGQTLKVAANFYPVQFLAERIGGEDADVTGLTPVGIEPHDLALGGQALQELRESKVLLYLGSDFQPDVERVAKDLPAGTAAVDLLSSPGLELLDPPEGAEHGAEHAGDHHEHKDPHVWLDPVRLKLMAEATAEAMSAADGTHAAAYAANLKELLAELEQLDRDLAAKLRNCERRTLLTSHAAFGYFADRYSLKQIPIAGISPDDEPDAKTLAQIAREAETAGVGSVFLEEKLNPALAETVAESIGAETRALSALEFDPGAGKDLISVMRDNGEQLRQGLGCR